MRTPSTPAHPMRRALIGASLAVATLTPATFTWAADPAFPSKTVQIIIPFPAGSAADNAMRVVARQMSADWKQPVVIENKAGIHGLMAGKAAAPDGHTLMLGAGSHMVTGPLIQPKLAYSPKDFVPVGRVLTNIPILTSHPSLGVKTVQDLVALAKKKPGTLNYSSSGIGSPNHLAMEMFQAVTGTQFVHVPYKGGAPSVNELIGGHVQVGINAVPSVIQHIKSGKLVALGVASAKRDRNLPQIPTMAEGGATGFEYEIWYGLFAPAKTPASVVATISQALMKAVQDPTVGQQLIVQGSEPRALAADEFARYIDADIARWKQIIKDRHIKPE